MGRRAALGLAGARQAVAALAFAGVCACFFAGQPARAAAATDLPFAFATDGYALPRVPAERLPFAATSVAPRVDPGCHDEQGVRMRVADGVLVDYPGGQASWGMENLNSYVLTGDEFYLERAEAQAQRLIDTSLHVGGAWFFPSRYARERHGTEGDDMTPPWFSCLGQGAGLALFCRLHEVTGDARYGDAAAGAFAAFSQAGPVSAPWMVTVDDGYLWFEEWPKLPLDHTLNGHVFAAYGVYEYWRVYGDERARALFSGAATTVRHHLPQFRRTGWTSRYCLLHQVGNSHYHGVHLRQMLRLAVLTGDVRFARWADRLCDDYPTATDTPPVAYVAAGDHRVFVFRGTGEVRSRRVLHLRAARQVAIAARQRIRGRGVYLQLAAGRLTGYWLRERSPVAYALGAAAALDYYPPRTVRLAAGRTYVGLALDPGGQVTESRALTPAEETVGAVSRRAVVNGVDRVLLDDGPLAGYWLPTARLRLY